MDRIALFLPNWVGDVVMATPAIRAVREHFPTARLLAVCRPYVAATIDGAPWFDDVILFDKAGAARQREVGVIRRLRRERVDAAVLFPNSFRSAAVAALGRCRRRIGRRGQTVMEIGHGRSICLAYTGGKLGPARRVAV